MNAKKVVPVILSVVGSAGVIGTGYLAVRAGQKNPTKPLPVEGETKFKYFIRTLKPYIPTIAVGTATIASITASTIMSKKIEASLSATVLMLEQGYKKYKGKVKDVLGEDKHKEILAKIAEDDYKDYPAKKGEKELFQNEYLGFFYAEKWKVERAYNAMNMRLNAAPDKGLVDPEQMGWYTLDDFIFDSDAELLDDTYEKTWKNFGWSRDYLDDSWDDTWINTWERPADESDPDFNNSHNYTIIFFDTLGPIYDPRYAQNVGSYDPEHNILDREYHEIVNNVDYVTAEDLNNEK